PRPIRSYWLPLENSVTTATTAAMATTATITIGSASCTDVQLSPVRAGVQLTDQSIWDATGGLPPLGPPALGAIDRGGLHAYRRADRAPRDGSRLRGEGDPPRGLGVRPGQHLAAGHPREGVGARPHELPHR